MSLPPRINHGPRLDDIVVQNTQQYLMSVVNESESARERQVERAQERKEGAREEEREGTYKFDEGPGKDPSPTVYSSLQNSVAQSRLRWLPNSEQQVT